MSRGRKKAEPAAVEEIVPEVVVEEEPVPVKEEPVQIEESQVTDAEPVIQDSTIVDEKARTIEWVTQYIGEHSRRRPGSVSGMMNTVYKITISGGRVRFFTLPINVEECAVEESWKRCRPYMNSEQFIAFLTRVLGIPPPPFYSVFRIISIE